MDIVTKLESLVNEVIQNKVVGYDLHRSYLLDSILENIPFATKLGLLKEWGLFDIFSKDKDSYFYKIKNIMNVRNHLAHQWTEYEALYQKKPLEGREVFKKFKTDLCSA